MISVIYDNHKNEFHQSIRYHCILNIIHILLKNRMEYENNEYCNKYCFLGVGKTEKTIIFILDNSNKDTVYLVKNRKKKVITFILDDTITKSYK